MRNRTEDRPLSGRELALEGAALRREFWPTAAERNRPRPRLKRLYRSMIDSGDPSKIDLGFFLFGLTGEMGGRGHA
ncbi:hypothetical protein [Sphingomonas turrisvirgatae]|uniref:hypothetical protein n=1 Tax=Sphingomonas turrisvirgatae TaxID=1888892 RepID=UPI0010426EE1|nr:hypothetical protein [Sphingomonas turrisvirgatae]